MRAGSARYHVSVGVVLTISDILHQEQARNTVLYSTSTGDKFDAGVKSGAPTLVRGDKGNDERGGLGLLSYQQP